MKYLQKINKNQEILKKAFIGHLWKHITPDPRENLPSKTLRRLIRKHPKQNLSKTKISLEVTKGVESLGKKVKKLQGKKIDYIPSTVHGYQENIVKGPSFFGPMTGHELGHALDQRTKSKKFFGDRGFLGFGGKVSTQLKSEASASRHFLDELPKKIRRKTGGVLASAYNTYYYNTRINPKDNMMFLSVPQQEGKSYNLFEKLQKGFKDMPEKPKLMVEWDDVLLDKIHAKADWKDWNKLKFFEKRRIAAINLENSKNISEYVEKSNIKKLENKKQLLKNLKTLNLKDKKVLSSEVQRFLKITKQEFGRDVTRGAIDEIRSFRNEFKKLNPSATSKLKKGFKSIKALRKFIH